jgi:hypothetical protein
MKIAQRTVKYLNERAAERRMRLSADIVALTLEEVANALTMAINDEEEDKKQDAAGGPI